MSVRFHTSGKRIVSLACATLFGVFSLPIGASQVRAGQTAPGAHSDLPTQTAPTDSASHLRELGDTVALLPWSYRNGKDAALQSARAVCNQLLLETGFNVLLIKSPTGAMPPAMSGTSASKRPESPFAHILAGGRALLGQETSNRPDSPYVLPTVEQMSAIGEKLETRYVLAGRAQWRSRNVWIGISNRVKSICTIDLLILDMNDKHLVLDARNVVGDSTEKKNMYSTVSSAISLNPLPLVLPGSVTPQEQQAVTVATAKAMEPWLKTERIKAALSQADESSETATANAGSTVRFSALVSSLSDLQVKLNVTEQDDKQLASLDSDLAKLYALHDINLDYKEPNKLLLSANSPKEGPEKLVINEANRSFVLPDHKKVYRQDVSGAPTRRFSLLDFCGVLTPSMFDYTRARFVKQEKLEGVNAVVFDLTYWGVDESPYHRVWIDSSTHLAVKNEFYDRGGTLKTITLYKQPKEVAAQLWLPTRVEIQSAAHKPLASITLTNARADQEISNDLFAATTP